MSYACPCCGTWVEGGRPEELLAYLPLSARERTIAEVLVKSFGRFVPTARVMDAVYGDREDGGPLSAASAISVAVSQANKKLGRVRLRITAKQGSGYRLFSLDEAAGLRERARAVIERELGEDAARRVFLR